MKMKSDSDPPFPTKHWRDLWTSNITNLDQLRKKYTTGTSGIVAVDIEPWTEDWGLPSEIAFSFLPPAGADTSKHMPPPTSFHAFSKNTTLRTRTISISGRAVGGREREFLHFGDVRVVDAENVEDAIVEILDSFSSEPNLTLIGWDLSLELKVISRDYPRALRHFSAWTDIQDQVHAISTLAGEKTMLGMKNSLRAFGYGWEHWAVNLRSHRAGNDTARVMAIFLHLMRRTEQSPPLPVEAPKSNRKYGKWRINTSRQAYKSVDNIFRSQPHPVGDYPFLAKLSLTSGALIERSALNLLEVFDEYEPTAIGLHHKSLKRTHAWIALPCPSALEQFVEKVSGMELDHNSCEIEAHVAPGYEDVTDQQWEEMRQAREARKKTEKETEDENKRLARSKNAEQDMELHIRLFSEEGEVDGESGDHVDWFADVASLSLK